MLTLPHSLGSRSFIPQTTRSPRPRSIDTTSTTVRTVRITLALYLLPALVLTLALGTIGLVVIGSVRAIQSMLPKTKSS
jgi:hypothetical protein